MQVWTGRHPKVAGRHPRVAITVAQAMKLCRSTLREFHWNWESVSVLFHIPSCSVTFILIPQPQTKSSSFYEAPTVTTNLPFLMISGFWHGVNEIVLFWDCTLHTMLVSYQRFGTPCHSHCQGFKLSCLKPKESAHNFFFFFVFLVLALGNGWWYSQYLLN
jgi:hypothetical protein